MDLKEHIQRTVREYLQNADAVYSFVDDDARAVIDEIMSTSMLTGLRMAAFWVVQGVEPDDVMSAVEELSDENGYKETDA